LTGRADGPPAWVEPVYEFGANKGPSLYGSAKPSSPSAYVDMMDRSGRLNRGDVLRMPGALQEVVAVSVKIDAV
jgi:hypothetical protein